MKPKKKWSLGLSQRKRFESRWWVCLILQKSKPKLMYKKKRISFEKRKSIHFDRKEEGDD